MKSRSLATSSLVLLQFLCHDSHADSAVTTTLDPQPPYAPGMKVHVRVAGPGMNTLSEVASFFLEGAHDNDFLASEAVTAEGTPPSFDWTFVVPKHANTLSPDSVSVLSKNGVVETLSATNTPALSHLSFKGIVLDQHPPVVSNFKFSQPSSGLATLEFDANDPSGVELTGVTAAIDGHAYDSNDVCSGTSPKFHCIIQATIPQLAQGSITFDSPAMDGAGNRVNLKRSYPLAKKKADGTVPSVAWPIHATVCADHTIRLNFKMNGGAGSLFEGDAGIWSDNPLTEHSDQGIAEQGMISCNLGDCETTFQTPQLVGLGPNTLNVQAGNQSSGSSSGGINAGHVLKISLIGINGKTVQYTLPASTVAFLAQPPSGEQCKTADFRPPTFLPPQQGPASSGAAMPMNSGTEGGGSK